MKAVVLPGGEKLFIDWLVGRPQGKTVWTQRAWLVVLFLGGLYLWGKTMGWGNGPVDFHDWALIIGPRLTFLREALLRGEPPLYLSAPATEGDITRRFLAIPDLILSPQVFLLPWLDVGHFVLLQFWLMYALGFWALLLLRRRFELSLLAFTILFFLFNFNGHILAHASVGHATWGGYFLYASFAVLVFDLLRGQVGWGWVTKVVFLALLIFLQGSYHQVIYMLFFLGLLALSLPRRFWCLVATAVFTVLVAAVRILPASMLLGQFNVEFIAGYPFGQSIWQYMTQPQIPNDLTTNLGLTKPVGTWELTFFVGIPAALFILYFGLARPFIEPQDQDHFQVLLLPVLGLVVLSLDKIFRILYNFIPIPIFAGERVAARIFSLAFVFILIVAVVQFQRWLEGHRLSPVGVLVMLLLVAVSAYDLQRNQFLWSVANVAKNFPAEKFDPSLYYPVNQVADQQYLTLLSAGLAVSLISTAGLLFLAWRERHISQKTHSILA